MVGADGVEILADRGGHLFDQLRAPCGAPRDRGGVDGGAVGGEAGEALLVDDGGDPEARRGGHLGLAVADGLAALGDGYGGGAEHAREVAQAVRDRVLPGDGVLAELALHGGDVVVRVVGCCVVAGIAVGLRLGRGLRLLFLSQVAEPRDEVAPE